MTGLGNLAAKQTELREQVKKFAQDNVKPSLQEAITDLNRMIPSLTAVRWRQYTPYFNDGDECTFHLHEVYFCLGGETAGDYDDGYLSSWDPEIKALTAEQQGVLKTFGRNLGEIEELLKTAFGDHAQVTLSLTGIDVTAYDHE